MSTALVRPHRRGMLRRGFALLGRAVRTQPKDFAIAVSGAVLFAMGILAQALVLGWVTDDVVVPTIATGDISAPLLAAAFGAVLAVGVAKSLGIIFRRVWAYRLQLGMQARYRAAVGTQYQRLSLAWHRRRRTGRLLAHANADAEMMFWPLAPLPFAVGVSVLLVASLGALALTDWALALVGALLIPAILATNLIYNRVAEQPAVTVQQRRGDTSAAAHEAIDGALVVKTLGREDAESERFAHESERLRSALVRLGHIRAVFTPTMETLPQIGVLAILSVGAWRVAQGAITTGDVVTFSYLLTLIAFPIRVLGFVLEELPTAVAGADRVDGVLAADEHLPGGTTPLPTQEGPAPVTSESVTFRYDETADAPTLEALDLAVRSGTIVAIVGPTGSGKSSLVALLARLYDPDVGRLRLDGVPLDDADPTGLRQQVAVAFQDAFLFDDTVRENIALGEPFTDAEIVEAARLAQADGFVAQLPQGYDTVVGERGTSLSGGQRQRIALARALVRKPRLLVLDDATSSVDPTVEARILAGLRSASLPSTVITVAARAATIAVADEILYLERGRLVGRGTHAELLEVPGYRRIVTAASAGGHGPAESPHEPADAVADEPREDGRAQRRQR